jgi:hypothetical protein
LFVRGFLFIFIRLLTYFFPVPEWKVIAL